MRADRLLSILFLLQTSERMTARQLATELEVSERTIYRDVDALCAAGVPIVGELGLGGGFMLPPNYRLNIRGLTQAEARALFIATISGPLLELGLDQALEAALLKLTATLPMSYRQEAEQARQRFHVDVAGWARSTEAITDLPVVQEAVWQGRTLNLRYRDDRGIIAERRVKPYGLVMKAGAWYLVGAVGDEVDVFRVAGIQGAELTDERFDRNATFDLKTYWRQWCSRVQAERTRYPPTIYVATLNVPIAQIAFGANISALLRKIGVSG